jgi:hypothetical protein
MQSGFITSRVAEDTITKIDITPAASTAKPSEKGEFFGEDGLSFRDVLDAVNPLNHIPLVSSWFEKETEHTPSTASKLAGGALLGGPIGFVASLASVIFEHAVGQSPSDAVYAALSGGDTPTTELASADSSPAISPATEQVAALETPVAAPRAARASGTGNAVLDLYGNSPASAHASYQKMQLLPYLKDVSTTKIL